MQTKSFPIISSTEPVPSTWLTGTVEINWLLRGNFVPSGQDNRLMQIFGEAHSPLIHFAAHIGLRGNEMETLLSAACAPEDVEEVRRIVEELLATEMDVRAFKEKKVRLS